MRFTDIWRAAMRQSPGPPHFANTQIHIESTADTSLAGTGRKRKKNDDDGDVTYINKSNKVFNAKVARYFDKYTSDIRANLERGTAL